MEKTRIGLQLGWVALFAFALLWVRTTWKKPSAVRVLQERKNGLARCILAASMLSFVGLWSVGATLEFMRRTMNVSGPALFVAIGAFSVLLAGILILTREWFAPITFRRRRSKTRAIETSLRTERVALTLLLLSFIGWWFGGFTLEWNTLFRLQTLQFDSPFWPEGWALSLMGAQLLAAYGGVRPLIVQSPDTLRNPVGPTFRLTSFALLLCWPRLGVSPLVTLIAGVGFAVWLLGVWVKRPEFGRLNGFLRFFLMIFGLGFLAAIAWNSRDHWNGQSDIWRQSTTWIELVVLLGLGLLLFGPLQKHSGPKRSAARVLASATLAGAVVAFFAFGPLGAIFWAFWPLVGLCFDSLSLPAPTPVPADPFADPFEVPADELTVDELTTEPTNPISA